MKKVLLSVMILIFSAGACFAQDINHTVDRRVNLITRIIASELGLNEAEYMRLKALNRDRIVKADEIAELFAHDKDLQAVKLQELEISFDKKFKTMLSPTQLTAYATYQHSPDSGLAMSKPGSPAANTTTNKIDK